VENIHAQRLFKKVGFNLMDELKNNIIYNGKSVNRYLFSIGRMNFEIKKNNTPINYLDILADNNLFIKRDDLLPYSFGGNKARKAINFFQEIEYFKNDYIITYGTSHSNHCRIISNLASSNNIPCLIISPEEKFESTNNSVLMKIFGSDIIYVPIEKVSETIDDKIKELKNKGYNPYFIPGGGHGKLGTKAYVDCFNEI